MDCTSWDGFQEASNMIHLLAATKFTPIPPALVEIKKSLALKFSSSLNLLICDFRLFISVDPSKRK